MIFNPITIFTFLYSFQSRHNEYISENTEAVLDLNDSGTKYKFDTQTGDIKNDERKHSKDKKHSTLNFKPDNTGLYFKGRSSGFGKAVVEQKVEPVLYVPNNDNFISEKGSKIPVSDDWRYLDRLNVEKQFPAEKMPGFTMINSNKEDLPFSRAEVLESLEENIQKNHLSGAKKISSKFGKTKGFGAIYNNPNDSSSYKDQRYKNNQSSPFVNAAVNDWFKKYESYPSRPGIGQLNCYKRCDGSESSLYSSGYCKKKCYPRKPCFVKKIYCNSEYPYLMGARCNNNYLKNYNRCYDSSKYCNNPLPQVSVSQLLPSDGCPPCSFYVDVNTYTVSRTITSLITSIVNAPPITLTSTTTTTSTSTAPPVTTITTITLTVSSIVFAPTQTITNTITQNTTTTNTVIAPPTTITQTQTVSLTSTIFSPTVTVTPTTTITSTIFAPNVTVTSTITSTFSLTDTVLAPPVTLISTKCVTQCYTVTKTVYC